MNYLKPGDIAIVIRPSEDAIFCKDCEQYIGTEVEIIKSPTPRIEAEMELAYIVRTVDGTHCVATPWVLRPKKPPQDEKTIPWAECLYQPKDLKVTG